MPLELKLVKQPEDISDDKSGDRLLATVEICGANHHLDLIRVVEDEEGVQVPENDAYKDAYDDYQACYDGIYETFEIPGFSGQYVAFMHPYET
jgi:hypothetical protein